MHGTLPKHPKSPPSATPYNDLDDYKSQAMPNTSIAEDALAITEIRQAIRLLTPLPAIYL